MTNMVTMRHWKMPSRPVIWIQTAQRSMMMDATMMDLSICVQNWSCPSTPQSRACIQNKTENLTEDAYLRQVIPSKIYNICLLYVWILIISMSCIYFPCFEIYDLIFSNIYQKKIVPMVTNIRKEMQKVFNSPSEDHQACCTVLSAP